MKFIQLITNFNIQVKENNREKAKRKSSILITGLLIGIAACLSFNAEAITITSNTLWSAISPAPTSSDLVFVKNDAILTVDVANAVADYIKLGIGGGSASSGTLVFNAGSQLDLSSGSTGTVIIGGSAAASGTVDMSAGGLLITKALTGSNSTLIPGTGTIRFVSTASLKSSITTYNNMEISGSGITVSLASGITLTGNLTLLSGTLNTTASNYALQVNGNATIYSTASLLTNSSNISIKGNVLVNPGGTYTNTGITTLSGSSPQSISGTYNTLIVNNNIPGNAITLNGPVTINNNLTLTSGKVVTTATNILTLGAAATLTLNAVNPDNSQVVGPMIQTIAASTTTTKSFPVGNGTNLHRLDLSVTQSAATSTQYTVEYINSSAAALGYTLPASLNKVSSMGYWQVSKGAGASVTAASTTLYYVSSDVVSDASNLRIATDNGSGVWTDLAGSGSAVTAGTITTGTNFTAFRKFTLANNSGGGNILPVTLMSFKAEPHLNTVDITWQTATETMNDFFTVEKSSDAIHFNSLVFIKGAGESTSVKSYKFTDSKPNAGTSYYRLKQTDFNGKSTWSKIISVDMKAISSCVLYPNPLKEHQQAFLSLTRKDLVHINIYDLEGNKIAEHSYDPEPGENKIMLNEGLSFKPGLYIIAINEGDAMLMQKLIVTE